MKKTANAKGKIERNTGNAMAIKNGDVRLVPMSR